MSEFGEALKTERVRAKKKLRDLSGHTGLSIGYLSDIEQGRKPPPDLSMVENIQAFLEISDDRLVHLADRERTIRPGRVAEKLRDLPELSELFFRVKDLSPDELKRIISSLDDD